jgi:dehydrogenase/reductase SDR family protein 7B
MEIKKFAKKARVPIAPPMAYNAFHSRLEEIMTRLADRVIWITGASAGIGEALVHALARRGNRIVVSARREGDLERVRREAGSGDAEIVVLPLDLSDGASLGRKVDEVVERLGRVDVLINNGGVSQRSLVMDTSMDVYRRIMEVNYFGTVGAAATWPW